LLQSEWLLEDSSMPVNRRLGMHDHPRLIKWSSSGWVS